MSDQDVGDDTEDPDAPPELIDADGLVTQHEFLLPAPTDQDGIVVAIDRGPRVVEPGDPCDPVDDSFAVDLIFRDELQDAPVEGRIR